MVKVDSDGGGAQERRQKSPLDSGFYFQSGSVWACRETCSVGLITKGFQHESKKLHQKSSEKAKVSKSQS